MAEAKSEALNDDESKLGSPSALERKDSKSESATMSPGALTREDSKAEGSPSSPKSPNALAREESKEEDDLSSAKSPNALAREDSKAEADPTSPSKEIVDLVMGFATSSEFEKAFELFTEENKDTFVPSMFDLGPNDEHPLAWHESYLDYLKTFEGKIERFIEGSGFKINDFYDKARDILEDEDVYGEAKFFLEALLATSEYEYFLFITKTTLADLGYSQSASSGEGAEEKE
jgi:hypothetical protein